MDGATLVVEGVLGQRRIALGSVRVFEGYVPGRGIPDIPMFRLVDAQRRSVTVLVSARDDSPFRQELHRRAALNGGRSFTEFLRLHLVISVACSAAPAWWPC